MDENRARRVADALRDRGINAHLENAGVDIYGVRVVIGDGREAIWGNEGTASLAEAFDDAAVTDAIARADYDEPVARERPEAPPPAPPLTRDGGVFRRFLDGFRYDSE
jgi:hypothetical protein